MEILNNDVWTIINDYKITSETYEKMKLVRKEYTDNFKYIDGKLRDFRYYKLTGSPWFHRNVSRSYSRSYKTYYYHAIYNLQSDIVGTIPINY